MSRETFDARKGNIVFDKGYNLCFKTLVDFRDKPWGFKNKKHLF
jgi:hypothetical protein